MGSEAKTTLTVGREKFSGTALLESTELLFRGETRLRIPLAAIRDVQAKSGALHIRHAEGVAVFALGDAMADKWAEKIRSPKSLADKLGVKSGISVAALHFIDESILSDIESKGASITRDKVPKACNLVLFRVTEAKSLSRLSTIVKSIARDGCIWVVHPRGVPAVADVVIFAAGKGAGLTATKVVKMSDTDTAEKLVIPLAQR